MKKNIETVKVTEAKSSLGDIVRDHPSFAVIGASRVSGHATLAGSPLRHHGYVNIRINYAREHISHTHSHFMPTNRTGACIAEISMSEAQWATFISTMNVGSGVPCTVEYAKGGDLVRHPLIEDETFDERRESDIRRNTEKIQEQLIKAVAALDELLEEKTISKKKLAEVRQMFIQPVDNSARNMEHIADMLTEHKDNLVNEAKAEVASLVARMQIQYPEAARKGIEFENSGDEEHMKKARIEYVKEEVDKHG